MKSNLKTSLVMFLVIFLFSSIFLSSFAADAAKYHFISILWMQGDPNLNWIIKSGQDYMAMNKDVDIEFTGPQNYDVTKHLEFLEAAIAKKPDGIYMHVSDPTTLKPAFEKAKKEGIPIVTHTGRFSTDILTPDLWLANVGWDEIQMGAQPAKYLLKNYGAPVHVASIQTVAGHAGQELRSKGFEQELPPGSKYTKVPIGEEPTKARELTIAFFQANPDVDVVFHSTSLAMPWVISALEEIGRTNIIHIGTSDSPADIEGIILGKVAFTNGIQFYLNGWYPPHVLYTYLKTGLTGPKYLEQEVMIVNKDNAEFTKQMIINIIGKEAYDNANPW
jgi:ribose transport system substrate-binding protein